MDAMQLGQQALIDISEIHGTIKSICESSKEALYSIRMLHNNGRQFDCDVTYGNGAFYAGTGSFPAIKFDIDPQSADVVMADSRDIPLTNDSIGSVVFDPPFLTYVRKARGGNGKMAMSRRYSGYWRYCELEEHYTSTIKECYRVLRNGGILVVKCQDIIHNHKMHPTHVNVVMWAKDSGMSLVDLFVLTSKSRMPSPNRKGKQKHARIFHSYFLVFRK